MVVSTTGSIQVPNGTTAQRPSGVTGQFRFNSSLTQFEGYDGSAWGKIGGGDLAIAGDQGCLLYTSPGPRDAESSRMPSSA